jgi:hypothetical protein
MKTKINLMLLFAAVVIVSTSFIKAQELPELPMKNGMAYYTFEHKLDNNECLAKYFSFLESTSMNTKVVTYCSQLTLQKSGTYKKSLFNLFIPRKLANGTKCLDTLKSNPGFSLSTIGGLMWRPMIIEFVRKKAVQSDIKAQIDIIFISKTQYKLVFKDLTYHIYWAQGAKTGIDIHNIGELYQKTKDSGKIDKSDIKFFEDLNFFIKSADEIILKSLTETYKAAEL